MQFLGPAEKGRYAYGWRPAEFSSVNLSGSNLSGSSNASGSRFMLLIKIDTSTPLGTVTPPTRVICQK